MPKPIDIPDIWASDAIYNIGPKSGLPTKTDTAFAIAAAANGHIPGKDFPTTANEFNLWCFEISNSAVWVMEGTSLPDQTAHIVETDGSGEIEVARALIGGTTATGPSLTVEEPAIGSGPSVLIKAVDDAAFQILHTTTAPNNFVESIVVTTDANAADGVGNDYVFKLFSQPATAFDGPGGLQVKSSGHNADTNGKFAATISGENEFGIAGLFLSSIGQGDGATLEANNTTLKGVALAIGLRTPGKGMEGIHVLAGESDPGANNIAGGLGIRTIGGEGFDGTNNQPGGDGLFSRGGIAVSGTPGRGAHIQSGGVGAFALELSNLVEPGQTAPLLFGDTGSGIGGGITMICEGSGHGARLETQAGAGLRLFKTATTGTSLIGTHIFFNPMTTLPNVTLFDGDMYFTELSTVFSMRMEAQGDRFIPLFTNPVVYGFNSVLAQTGAGALGVFVPALTTPLSSRLRPTASGVEVIITVHCYVSATAFTPPLVGAASILVKDDNTTLEIPAGERQVDLSDGTRHYISYSFAYTIPTAGPISFTLGIQRDDADPTTIVIGEISLKIETRWD